VIVSVKQLMHPTSKHGIITTQRFFDTHVRIFKVKFHCFDACKKVWQHLGVYQRRPAHPCHESTPMDS
jgi:hypothetical protein